MSRVRAVGVWFGCALLLGAVHREGLAQRVERAGVDPAVRGSTERLGLVPPFAVAVENRCLTAFTVAGIVIGGVAGFATAYHTATKTLGDIVYVPFLTLVGAGVGGAVGFRVGQVGGRRCGSVRG